MTTFIMPTAPTTATITPPGQSAYHSVSPTRYQQQQNPQPQYTHFFTSHAPPVSPLTSTTTSPHNASPTSPRTILSSQNLATQQPGVLPLHSQQNMVRNLQLRPPKSPLYVPAVLRPTEPPKGKRIPKPSPLTPPRSAGSSFDDLSVQAQGMEARRPLSRRSTIDSAKWVGDKGKEVTRSHWLPDTSSPICTSISCSRSFSFYTRRHHCRRCGNLFCSTHSSHTVPLNSDANFDDRDGTPVRACEGCFDKFCAWRITRDERNRTESEFADDLMPQSPAVAMGSAKGPLGAVVTQGQGLEVAPLHEMGQSVPRDWTWSTF